MCVRFSCSRVILVKLLHRSLECRHKWFISWFCWRTLPSSIQCFNGWKGIMKRRSWARGKCLLCVVSMLQDENISSNTKFMVEHYCTCRRLQNNRTRFHSSSVRVRSPILRRFSALVSRMLSSYTKSSTNWKETRQLHIKKGSIIHTSLFSSALLSIT